MRSEDDQLSGERDEYGEYADMGGSEGENELTPEEQELMNEPNEDLE